MTNSPSAEIFTRRMPMLARWLSPVPTPANPLLRKCWSKVSRALAVVVMWRVTGLVTRGPKAMCGKSPARLNHSSGRRHDKWTGNPDADFFEPQILCRTQQLLNSRGWPGAKPIAKLNDIICSPDTYRAVTIAPFSRLPASLIPEALVFWLRILTER